MTEEQFEEWQRNKDLYEAGKISRTQYLSCCMKITRNYETERTLFRLRGIAQDSARIVQDVTRIERESRLCDKEKVPQVELVNEFAKEFKSTPPNIDSIIWKLALELDRKICEFAIERKTKKVFSFKKTNFSDNGHCTVDYRLFDETEEDMAREFAKSNATDFKIADFSYVLGMSDEEFERIVGSMQNADVARKYRQVMKEQEQCANFAMKIHL